MARFKVQNFANPDARIPFEKGYLETIELGDFTIGRSRQEPGWRWSEHIKPIVGTESCQFHHIGVILSGRLAFEMDDGVTFEAGPGDTMDVAPGHDAWVVGDQPVIGIEFIGVRGFAEAPEADLVLMTLLFTDIVDSTATAEKMGDARWHERLLAHNDLVRGALDRYQGREVKTTGDGFLASFDSPVRAVNSAKAIRTAVSNLGLSLRIGIHTGEAQRAGNDLKGISVHVAARVMAEAGRDEILVSGVTRQLIGSKFTLESRGSRALKGLDELMELFSVG